MIGNQYLKNRGSAGSARVDGFSRRALHSQ